MRWMRGAVRLGLAMSMWSACASDASRELADDVEEGTQITIKTYPTPPPYEGPTVNAELVAIQDGDGPWRVVEGSGGVYVASIAGPRYAVAAICKSPNAPYATTLNYASTTELTELRTSACAPTLDAVRVAVDLTLPITSQARVWFGSAEARRVGVTGTYEANVVKGRPVDVRIQVTDLAAPARLFRGPTLNAQAPQTLAYDSSAIGAPLASHALTVTGRASESMSISSELISSAPAYLSLAQSTSTGAPFAYASLPLAGGRQPSDLSRVTANTALQGMNDNRLYARGASLAMATPGDATLALPLPWTTANVALDASPLRRATLDLPATPAVEGLVDYAVYMLAAAGPQPHRIDVNLSAGWLAGQPAQPFTTPDLSGLPGWQPAMAFAATETVTWMAVRIDHPAIAAPSDGTRILTNQIIGTIQPTS